MARLLQFSEAANLGIHSLTIMAGDGTDEPWPAWKLSHLLSVSEAHLSKVLQRLAKHGIVRSIRGKQGGYLLDRPSDEISLLEIVEILDGPIVLEDCLLGNPACKGHPCLLFGILTSLRDQIHQELERTTLAQMAGSGTGFGPIENPER